METQTKQEEYRTCANFGSGATSTHLASMRLIMSSCLIALTPTWHGLVACRSFWCSSLAPSQAVLPMQDTFVRSLVSNKLSISNFTVSSTNYGALIRCSVWNRLDSTRDVHGLFGYQVLAAVSGPRNLRGSWCWMSVLPGASNRVDILQEE